MHPWRIRRLVYALRRHLDDRGDTISRRLRLTRLTYTMYTTISTRIWIMPQDHIRNYGFYLESPDPPIQIYVHVVIDNSFFQLETYPIDMPYTDYW